VLPIKSTPWHPSGCQGVWPCGRREVLWPLRSGLRNSHVEITRSHRDFGRRAAEDWLIRERCAKLGATQLKRRIYFCLGNFADGRDRSHPPCSLVMPLSVFPPAVLTLTYPDSMASLPLATLPRHIGHKADYHGCVFTLSEIRGVGVPGEQWKTEPSGMAGRLGASCRGLR